MSFENAPKATALITLTTPVIIAEHPASLVYTSAISSSSYDEWANRAGVVGGLGKVNSYPVFPSPWSINSNQTTGVGIHFQRLVTGLTIGRSYTFRAKVSQYTTQGSDDLAQVGVVGIGYGTSTLVSTTAWTDLSYTFTATSTSHTLAVNVTGPAGGAALRLTAPSLTQDAWNEVSYTADLTISDGTISLDSGWSPYVQGSVTVPLTTEDLLERIDLG